MTTETHKALPQPNDPNREPVINSPFETPQWRWQLDASTKAHAPALPGRRESQNIPPVAVLGNCEADSRSQTTWVPLDSSQTRQRHQDGCPEDGRKMDTQASHESAETSSTTGQTRKPANSTSAQLDAVLTHIYLHEAASDQVREEIQGINDRYNDGIYRIAHKMATASGRPR